MDDVKEREGGKQITVEDTQTNNLEEMTTRITLERKRTDMKK